MAITLVAFTESQSITALANVAGLADPHVRVVSDDIVIPALVKVSGYYVLGSMCTEARLVSPSLRAIASPDVLPIDVATEPSTPYFFHDRFETVLVLERGEALNFQVNHGGAGSARDYCLVWLTDLDKPVTVTGKIITVRCSTVTSLTANAWTNGALTFTQTLPAGRYAVVGMKAQAAGLIAARLVIPGSSWRPGVIGSDADSDIEIDRFRYGRSGVWGEFEHNEPPTADFLSLSTDPVELVYLDLVKVK